MELAIQPLKSDHFWYRINHLYGLIMYIFDIQHETNHSFLRTPTSSSEMMIYSFILWDKIKLNIVISLSLDTMVKF